MRMRCPIQLVKFIVTEELVSSIKTTHMESKVIAMVLVYGGDGNPKEGALRLMVPYLMQSRINNIKVAGGGGTHLTHG